MIRQVLFGSRSIELLKGGLDAGAARMRATAENIANAETPGYQPREVRFEELLGRAQAKASVEMACTSGAHLAPAVGADRPRIEVRLRAPGTGEAVDVERELVEMQKNEIQFQALSQVLADKYRGLREAIRPS